MTTEPDPQGAFRAASLGDLHCLPDMLIVEHVLAQLEPTDLCSLALTSRFLHVFARNDLLWRRLFFARRGRESARLIYRGTWLLTYIFPQPEHDEACANHPLVKHPTVIQGITSGYLHQQWIRSSMFFGHFYPPPPMPPTRAIGENRPVNPTIPVEDYQELDTDTFYRRYAYPNRPVMIQNSGVETWPAWEQWTLDALAAQHGDTLFRVSNIDSNTVPSFDLCFKDFLHYLRHNRDQDPLYLFDPRFVDTVPEMGVAYEVPKYFETDFFSLLKGDARPPFRWILIGPQRTGAPWHIDPSGTSAWNTLLSGHKRWALYPPHMPPPGHDPTSPKLMSSVEWYLDVYPFLPPEARPIEIVQHPGQTIYVPSGWWHMVLNMDDTVAVTHNFADETNLVRVRQSLRSNSNELSQIKRWEGIARELPAIRPDLALVIQPLPEELLLTQLKEQPSWLDPASPDTVVKWQERVQDVLCRTIGTADSSEIVPLEGGQNACFFTDTKFVKFFTPFHDGYTSFLCEVKSNNILLKLAEKRPQSQILSTPKMLGYGYLLDSDQAASTDWRWPYIIMEKELGPESGKDGAQLDLLSAKDWEPVDERGYADLLPPLLSTLQYIHTLDPVWLLDEGSDQTHISHRKSLHYTQDCLQSTILNHSRWRAFPKHLLELMPAYLPKDASEIFNPSRGDPVATLVHGDVNPGNVLGFQESTSTSDTRAVFQPTSLIDYGDAVFLGDPLIDIVSVFVTILNCRRDWENVRALSAYWAALTKSSVLPQTGARLAKRCMWQALLWPSEGLSMHLTRCMPEIGEISSWEEVEDAVFGWWAESR